MNSTFHYEEKQQDLFLMGKEYVLAHCVSQDCAMGAGIALEFRKKIPEMPDAMKALNPQIGDALHFHTRGGRDVINLFTKEKAYNKPTYKSLTASLVSLRKWMLEHDKHLLAIPHIGCGLDKLKWEKVRVIIQKIFADDDITIIVCEKD